MNNMFPEVSIAVDAVARRKNNGNELPIYGQVINKIWLIRVVPVDKKNFIFVYLSVFMSCITMVARTASTILSALASGDVNPSMGPPHSPSLMGLLLMGHKLSKRILLERDIRTLIRHVSFPSPTDVGLYIPPLNRAQRPRHSSLAHQSRTGSDTICNNPGR
ncbi:hypothetical protein PIB30_043623 [Stylosanthes scabra]|uniref:Uncharacterized protein n=1 Tax=Stylosanthes scabra TaxID=79078 RepID=A0ABU6VEY0_9FABA|nr:hypothetical protein [Stylosanthes scabra]